MKMVGSGSAFAPAVEAGTPFLSAYLLENPPLAPASKIFLLPALAHVGKSTEGDGWLSWESQTLHYPQLAAPTLTVADVLARHRPPAKTSSIGHLGSRPPTFRPTVRPSYEDQLADYNAKSDDRLKAAQEAVAHSQKAYEDYERLRLTHLPGVTAIYRAFRALSYKVVDGDVKAFSRPVAGGGVLEELPPSRFQDEALVHQAIRAGRFNEGASYLFFEREDLERAFPLEGTASADAAYWDGIKLSPYMALMLDIAKRWEIDPQNPPKASALQKEIESTAAKFGLSVGPGQQLSTRNVSVMATFLRPPPGK